MIEYIPTTEAIKANYSYGEQAALDITVADCDAQFEAWLAEVKAEAWEEGCRWGVSNFHILKESYTKNPYRQGEGNG